MVYNKTVEIAFTNRNMSQQMSMYLVILDGLAKFAYLLSLQQQCCFTGLLLLCCSSCECTYRCTDIVCILWKCCICSHLLLSSVGIEGAKPFAVLSLGKYNVYSSEKAGELINTRRKAVQRQNMRMQKMLVLRHEILTFPQSRSLKSLYMVMFVYIANLFFSLLGISSENYGRFLNLRSSPRLLLKKLHNVFGD